MPHQSRSVATAAAASVAAVVLLVPATVLLVPATSTGDPVPVQRSEGVVHGFLVLRALDGTTLADGDLIQVARGNQVTARLAFRFRDGSIHDETAIYTQRKHFRLVSSRLVQKGPAFPYPLELSVDATSGTVTVQYEDDGEKKVKRERLELPPDVANGTILTLLKNLRPDALPTTVSMVAATPAPRVVKLEITSAGRDRFSTGRSHRTAMHYVIKVDIGGITGLLARLTGRQPLDSHVWILGGEAPAFVKSEQPLYAGGPLWRIELVSPVWDRAARREPACSP
jgi:hypothetical protein